MKGSARTLSAVFLASFLCLFSCGLPKTIFLSPPTFSKAGANVLILTHNIDNYDSSEGSSQSFKGYEIYYRAYESLSAAENAVSSLQSLMSANETNPTQFMSSAESTGFTRMRRGTTSEKPLIPVASADSAASAQLQIPPHLDMSDWEMTMTNPADSFPVFRTINDQLRWSFYDTPNFLQGDTDYSGASNPSSVNFVFFAVAYGNDPEEVWQEVYSLPDSITVSGNIVSYQ